MSILIDRDAAFCCEDCGWGCERQAAGKDRDEALNATGGPLALSAEAAYSNAGPLALSAEGAYFSTAEP